MSHLKDLLLNMDKRGVYGNLCWVSSYKKIAYAIAYSGMKAVALTVPFLELLLGYPNAVYHQLEGVIMFCHVLRDVLVVGAGSGGWRGGLWSSGL